MNAADEKTALTLVEILDGEFVDLDEGNKVVKRFKVHDGQLVEVIQPKPATHYFRALLATFLPAGFPHTVTSDYLLYQTFDSLQAFSSSIASLLASRAVLQGLGVGDAESNPTGALVVTILQQTSGRLATILFASKFGTAIEPECKQYRFLADIFNDTALLLDLLSPAFPHWSKVLIMSSAAVLRALCGVAASASKATLSAHFALNGNLAELNAKEASQETVVSLLGMLAGTVLVHFVSSKSAVWTWMLMLVGLHLYTNYLAVRAVKMRTLNRQRATLVFRAFCESAKHTVLNPAEVAERESILFDSSLVGLPLRCPEFVSGTREFARRGGQAAIAAITSAPSNSRKYMRTTASVSSNGAKTRGSHNPLILLRHGFTARDALEAWFRALSFTDIGGDKKAEETYGLTEQEVRDFIGLLEKAGWDVDNLTLLTKSAARYAWHKRGTPIGAEERIAEGKGKEIA